VTQKRIRLGAHMSTSRGYEKVPMDSTKIGGNTFQIFPHSPSMWRARLPDEELALKFKSEMSKARITREDALVHSGYLINLASPKDDVREKSIDLLALEMKIVSALGLKCLTFHPGSHLGTGLDNGIERIVRGLEIVFSRNEDNDVLLLLENVAAKGGNIGSRFEELREIIDLCTYRDRLYVTYDTCHGFDSGYDLSSRENVQKLIDSFGGVLGLERLLMIHVNDSKYPLGAGKDRHARIGEGYIGKEGFKHFLSNDFVQGIPWLLETPGGDSEHAEDITIIKNILGLNGAIL